MPAMQLVLDDRRRGVGELAAGAAQEAGMRDHRDDALWPLQQVQDRTFRRVPPGLTRNASSGAAHLMG